MDSPALALRAVSKSFGAVPALNHLDLSIPYGEIYGLLGANGAGKTTALRIVCGVLGFDSGEGTCVGTPLGRTPRGIGYMPQRGGLYEDLTVIENLRFFARAQGLAQPSKQADNAASGNGLMPHRDRKVANLSGGWRQRVALAAVLMHTPRLLLLDEPTAGLDPQAREALWQTLRELSARGVAILVTTHHIDEAERCDRIGYLDAGSIKVSDSPTRIARALGLSAWRIDVSTLAPPNIAGLCYRRSADELRLLAASDHLPSEFLHWAAAHGQQHPQAVQAVLADALCWLALAGKESSAHA